MWHPEHPANQSLATVGFSGMTTSFNFLLGALGALGG